MALIILTMLCNYHHCPFPKFLFPETVYSSLQLLVTSNLFFASEFAILDISDKQQIIYSVFLDHCKGYAILILNIDSLLTWNSELTGHPYFCLNMVTLLPWKPIEIEGIPTKSLGNIYSQIKIPETEWSQIANENIFFF